MAGMPASVFGRQAPSSVASSVMNSPSMNAMPSPSDPLQMPADEKAKEVARFLAAAYEWRRLAQRQNQPDPVELMELDRVVDFGERTLSALVGSDAFAVAPGQTPAPPQAVPGQPAAVGPQPGMAPGSPPATGGIAAA